MFINTIGENKILSDKISSIFSLHKSIIHSQDYYVGGSLTNFFKLQQSAEKNTKRHVKKNKFLNASYSFLINSKKKRQILVFYFLFLKTLCRLMKQKY